MNYWKNYTKKIILLTTLLCNSIKVPIIYGSSNQGTSPPLTSLPSRGQEIAVPAGGNSFSYAIMLAYLFPAINNDQLFQGRLEKLVGEQSKWTSKELCHYLKQLSYADMVSCLHLYPFHDFIIDMKRYLKIDVQVIGIRRSVQLVANQLNVIIRRYRVADDLEKLASPICNFPRRTSEGELTVLKIVQDKPMSEELPVKFTRQIAKVKNINQKNAIKEKIDRSKINDNGAIQNPKSIELIPSSNHYRPLLDTNNINQLKKQDQQLVSGNSIPLFTPSSSKLSTPQLIIPDSVAQLSWSSSPYECAILNNHIHTRNIRPSQTVDIQLHNPKKIKTFPNWKVYQNLIFENKSCQAVIYHNSKKKQVVLAYKALSSLKYTDDSQNSKAHTESSITRKDLLWVLHALQQSIFSQKNGNNYGVTITGYQASGKLAQLTILLAHIYQDIPQYSIKQPIQVITFDSQGAKSSMLAALNETNGGEVIEYLNITNYYTISNPHESLGISPGSCYSIVPQKSNQGNPVNSNIDSLFTLFSPQYGFPITQEELLCDTKSLSIVSEIPQYDGSLLHSRHIPKHLQEWVCRISEKYSALFSFLEEYLAPSQSNNLTDFWVTKQPYDTRCILDAFLSLEKKYAYLINPFKDSLQLSRKIQKKSTSTPLNNLPKIAKYVGDIPLSQATSGIDLMLHANLLAQGYLHRNIKDIPSSAVYWIKQYLAQHSCCIINDNQSLQKSTLANVYAHQQLKRKIYQHIWWIDCKYFDKSIAEILQKLHQEDNGNYHIPVEKSDKKLYIKKFLKHFSDWLLVIDNATNLYTINDLLPHHGHTLVVSRSSSNSWNHLGSQCSIN